MILCANCLRWRATHRGYCWNCSQYQEKHQRGRPAEGVSLPPCDCDPSGATPAAVWVEYQFDPFNRLSVSNGKAKARLALCRSCYGMWEEDEIDTPYTIAWIGRVQNETDEMQALPT